MKEVLYNVIEILFSKLPFSKENEQLKENLKEKLILKYEEEIKNGNEIEIAGKMISCCQNIESICQLVDYPLDNYKNNTSLTGIKDYKKIIKKLRKYNIFISLFIAFIGQMFINIICYLNIKSVVFNGLLICLLFLMLWVVGKKKKTYFLKENYVDLNCDTAVKEHIYDLNDRYTKKLMNTMMMDIALVSYIVLFVLLSVLLTKYTYLDIIQQLSFLSTYIEMMVFLTIKHYLNKKLTDIYLTDHKKEMFHQYLMRLVKLSSGYFVVVILLMSILKDVFVSIFNWIIVFWMFYFVMILVTNLTIRKDIVFKNINMNIKRVVTISLLALCVLGYNVMSIDMFLTQPYINQVSQIIQQKDNIVYDDDTGVYTITTQKGNFKILQLTDIHLGGSVASYTKDIKSLDACYTLIKYTQPDLVVVTGDLVFPMGIMSFSFNNNAPIMQFANFMRNTGIPWAFTYGNHDTEGIATLDKNEFDDLMKSLSFKTSANLLYPYVQPGIYGRNNQIIEIRNENKKLMQALFLIDSNDYIPTSSKVNEYDYIHDDQVEWYEKNVLSLSQKEGYTIPSMLFFHIPLREYITANDLYEKGSDEVKYYYGTLGETMIDKICASQYESCLFDTAVKLNSTKAMFFGHDHYNNQSLEYKGIRMTYGYSIDYLAMPGIEDDEEQRGATLITIDQNGDFVIEPYRLIDIQ